jgi:hypothetical protein
MDCKCGCSDPPAPPEGGQPRPRPKRDEHQRDLTRRLEEVDRRLQELEKAA